MTNNKIVWFNELLFLLFTIEIIAIAGDYILIDDTIVFNSLSDSMPYKKITETIITRQKYAWIGYVSLPFIYVIKMIMVYLSIRIGILFQENIKINTNIMARNLTLIEFLFLIPAMIKIIWFSVFKVDYSLNDLQLFYPLSLMIFFESSSVSAYLIYPLQTLNLFEVGYWFLLAYGVADATGFSVKRSFGLVMSSYGVGLVLWVVLVMFLTITYS